MNGYYRSILSCVLCLALATSLNAQGPRGTPLPQVTPGEDWVAKIFDVKYADLSALQTALSIFGIQMTASPSLHVLSVRAPKEIMPAIEDAIRRLDVAPPVPPPPSKGQERVAELVVYVLSTTNQQNSGSVPSVLDPVVTQLRSIFAGYKGFQLLDTLLVRTPVKTSMTSQQPRASGTLPVPNATGQSTYTFGATFLLRPDETKGASLFLQNMSFNVKVPRMVNAISADQFYQVGISTDIEIRPGQQVVVGKTSVGETPLILVMSARFLD